MILLLLSIALSVDDRCVAVDAATITAADLAVAIPEFAALDGARIIAPSPAYGVRRELSASSLNRMAGTGTIQNPVCIFRRNSPVSDEAIGEAIRSALQTEFNLSALEAKIHLTKTALGPGGSGTLEFSKQALSFDRTTDLYIWKGGIRSPERGLRRTVTANFQMNYRPSCLAAARRLQIGDAIQPADVELHTRPWMPRATECIATVEATINQVLRRSLERGSFLSHIHLVEAPLIRPGDEVSVASIAGGTRILVSALARNKARMGEPLIVSTVEGKRLLRTIVTGPAKAEIRVGIGRSGQ